MAVTTLEERVACVEAELERLKTRLASADHAKPAGWERILGTFADSEGFEEAVRLGREYREAQRPPDDRDAA